MLFNDTIHYNIQYGRLDATREEVEEAARQVGYGACCLTQALVYTLFVNGKAKDAEDAARKVGLSAGSLKQALLLRAVNGTPSRTPHGGGAGGSCAPGGRFMLRLLPSSRTVALAHVCAV